MGKKARDWPLRRSYVAHYVFPDKSATTAKIIIILKYSFLFILEAVCSKRCGGQGRCIRPNICLCDSGSVAAACGGQGVHSVISNSQIKGPTTQ